MIIHYSPSYDGEIFLNSATALMGVSYVGTQGLLDFLQLRAGLHMEVKAAVEREADYMSAMRGCVHGTLFENAFRVDEMGVAGKLLRWRDGLMMAGWDGKCTDPEASKLAVLARIEAAFSSLGNADCWARVCAEYESGRVLDGSIREIVIECAESEIPHIVFRTLAAIEKYGTTVTRVVKAGENPEPLRGENVTLLEFEDVNDAYEWIARVEELPADTVVVNRDNIHLNHVLGTWNRPQVHSRLAGCNPQLLQLFKLGMSIFSRPLHIGNLISYLQLPLSPVPAALRHKLSRVLIGNGGFGEKKMRDDGIVRDEWEQTLHTFEFLNDEGKATGQAREKKMPFIAPVRRDYADGVDKSELAEYLYSLQKWVNDQFADKNMAAEKSLQLHELRSLVASFAAMLDALACDKVAHDDVEKLVRQIYRPMDYALQQSENGALNVIDNINMMATAADTLIWLDCQEEKVERDPFDFLSQRERGYLAASGVVVPDFATHLREMRRARFAKLASAGRVVIVRSAYNGAQRLGEHSLVAELRRLSGCVLCTDSDSLFKMIDADTLSGQIDKFAPVAHVELGEIDYKGRVESNSSLDTLINLPFNYVANYVAKLREPDNGQQKELQTIVGLVAHSFFEHVIGDGEKNFEKMRAIVTEEFESRLESAIDATGLALRLPENTSRLNNFSVDLKESMCSLIKIMEHLRLTPVACEVSLPQEGEKLLLERIGEFGARVDFLLLNEERKYVVFDFKWSFSKKNYDDKLEQNMAIQLELYRQAVKQAMGGEVAAVGYYLMPRKQLVTCDYDAIPDSTLIKKIEKAATTNTLFEQIQNSYCYRMKEIARGHIEEGEMMNIMDLDDCYYGQQEELNLFPMAVNEKTTGRGAKKELESVVKESEKVYRNTKKFSFDDAKREPCETPTSYSILKGRLK